MGAVGVSELGSIGRLERKGLIFGVFDVGVLRFVFFFSGI